jgi:hypothetical protein
MQPITRRIHRYVCGGALLGAVFVLAGCGESRKRHPVSGTVTYQGKPVQMGSIRFEADQSVGDFAAVCYASITDGKYETKREESPTNGMYRVQVMGIDVARINKNVPPGVPWDMPALFQPHSMTVEIPPPDGKLNIEIPDKKGKGATGK